MYMCVIKLDLKNLHQYNCCCFIVGASDSSLSLLRAASQSVTAGGVPGPSSTNSSVRERVVDRGRTRSLSSVPGASNGGSLSIPTLLSRATGGSSTPSASGGGGIGTGSDSEGSSPEEYMMEAPLSTFGLGRVFATHSLPAHLWSLNGEQQFYTYSRC